MSSKTRSIEVLKRLPISEKITYEEMNIIDDYTSNQDFDVSSSSVDSRTRAEPLSSHPTRFGRDLGPFGQVLAFGPADGLKKDFVARVARLGSRQAAVDELAGLSFGLLQYPILRVLMSLMHSNSSKRSMNIDQIQYLFSQGLPADLRDLTGGTPLSTCLLTQPFHVTEATMMYEAGGDVNSVDRMGRTGAHYGALISSSGMAEHRLNALEWMIERGANLDTPIAGPTPFKHSARNLLEGKLDRAGPVQARRARALLKTYDELRRKEAGRSCGFCLGLGRKGGEAKDSLKCSRCCKTLYCGRECQKRDWTHHKKTCSPSL